MTASIYSNVVMQFDLFRLDEYLKKLSVEGNECLPLVSGGEIASTFDDPESVKLGYCDLIAKILIGGAHYLVGSCSSLLLGS
ncbi:T-complex protein 1 subunit beta [Trifolium repens]|nr:T-complex protein 1 subunit beta [Trifolium repens]